MAAHPWPFPCWGQCHEPEEPPAAHIKATLVSFLIEFGGLEILLQLFEEGRNPHLISQKRKPRLAPTLGREASAQTPGLVGPGGLAMAPDIRTPQRDVGNSGTLCSRSLSPEPRGPQKLCGPEPDHTENSREQQTESPQPCTAPGQAWVSSPSCARRVREPVKTGC